MYFSWIYGDINSLCIIRNLQYTNLWQREVYTWWCLAATQCHRIVHCCSPDCQSSGSRTSRPIHNTNNHWWTILKLFISASPEYTFWSYCVKIGNIFQEQWCSLFCNFSTCINLMVCRQTSTSCTDIMMINMKIIHYKIPNIEYPKR